MILLEKDQCYQLWRNFANLANNQYLAIHLRAYLILGKILSLLLQKIYAIGRIGRAYVNSSK